MQFSLPIFERHKRQQKQVTQTTWHFAPAVQRITQSAFKPPPPSLAPAAVAVRFAFPWGAVWIMVTLRQFHLRHSLFPLLHSRAARSCGPLKSTRKPQRKESSPWPKTRSAALIHVYRKGTTAEEFSSSHQSSAVAKGNPRMLLFKANDTLVSRVFAEP